MANPEPRPTIDNAHHLRYAEWAAGLAQRHTGETMAFFSGHSGRAACSRLSMLARALGCVALISAGCDDDVDADRKAGDGREHDHDGGEHGHGDSGSPGSAGDASTEPSDAGPASDAGNDAAAAEEARIYAHFRSADESTFVTLTDAFGLKSDSPALAPAKAREFQGAVIAQSGNLLEINEATVKQWKVSDTRELSEGPSVNFSEFPLAEGANDFFQFVVDDHHMFLPFEIVNRVVWDPIDMKIVEVVEGDSKIPLKHGDLKALPGGNRSKIVYKGTTKMPVFYLDEEYIHFAEHTALGVYDPKTFKELTVIDLPCPGLAIATQDEAGYTYYSTWDYSPLLALYEQGPKPCLARLTPGDELEEAWTTDLTDLTDGRYVANFNYVHNGWALMDVLHHETLDLDFTASQIPDDALTEVWDTKHWQIWAVDLKNKVARPLDELGDDIHRSFWGLVRVDDHVLLNIETEEDGSKLYEIDETGHASLFDTGAGTAISWSRVR
jgi:hypothetical protein